MKPINSIFYTIILSITVSAYSQNSKSNKLFTNYHDKGGETTEAITFHADSTYSYHFGSCLVSCSDSGKFKLIKDTIVLVSNFPISMKKKYLETHDEICPHTNTKYILKRKNLYCFNPSDKKLYRTKLSRRKFYW